MDFGYWKKEFERRNKELKRDITIFAIVLIPGVILLAWCIAQIINSYC